MIKIVLFVFVLLSGCSHNVIENSYSDINNTTDFIDMEEETIVFSQHIKMCKENNESVFCKESKNYGNISPTKKYSMQILKKMNYNFEYENDDYWHYNDSIYETLVGDCEDIALTMANHMISDGISKESIYLVYIKTSDTTSHMFLAVDTIDSGLLHLDYANSGYPIEENINFHMKMSNAGTDKWIKGNIK